MHPKVLSAEVWALISDLNKQQILEDWFLCGGTGLALHLGHRISEDLDFFTPEDFQPEILAETLTSFGQVQIMGAARGTLHVLLRQFRLSFLHLEAPLNFPGTTYRGLLIADPRDIAVLKLIAISGRGSRKDFIDLYIYLQNTPGLDSLFELMERRNSSIDWNRYHILKSLTYFDDAEEEPIPNMLMHIDWDEVKDYFKRTATSNL